MSLPCAKMTQWLLCVTWLLFVCASVNGQTNNTIGPDGTIIWGDLPPDKAYKTVGYEADDGGLDPYYALAKSFIDSSLPADLPIAEAKGMLDGSVPVQEAAQRMAKTFIGFFICIAIGFLFFFIFPIVACCFCCCRCCGNCGGKRIQKQDSNTKCKRYVFSAIVFVLAAFVLTGAACTFVTSNQLSKNLGSLGDSVSSSLDDMRTFVDNIYSQFKQLGDTNFVFLKDTLTDYVADASGEISETLISEISNLVNLDGPLDNIAAWSGQAMADITELESKLSVAETQRDNAVTDLEAVNTASPCSNCIDVEIAKLNALNFTAMRVTVSGFKDKVQTDVFNEMKSDFATAINSTVTDATKNIDVATKLDEIYNDQIKPMMEKVETLKNNTGGDLDSYSDMVNDGVNFVEPFDKYRWYAGLGLACFLALIAVLMLVGVLLGVLCGSADDRPTERGAASNCGGIMLMSAVGLIFIFGALLMLLTTMMYLVGSVTERYGCQTFDDLSKVEKYTSDFDLGMDLKNISFSLSGNTISLGVSKLMDGCERGETLYSILGLSSVVDDALSEIDKFREDLNFTVDAGDAFSSSSGQVDVDDAISALEDGADDAETLKEAISDMKTEVETVRDDIDSEPNTDSDLGTVKLTPLITTLGEMEQLAANINQTANLIKEEAQVVKTRVTEAQTKLSNQTIMEPLISNVSDGLVNTLFGFADSYIDDVKEKLENDVAKCTPLYSIVNAIFSEAFCHGIIDPLNGFWLALGWCIFFFMPGLIFSVKLAKHFRRMLYEDGYSDPTIDDNGQPPSYTEMSGKSAHLPPLFPPDGNKVAPF